MHLIWVPKEEKTFKPLRYNSWGFPKYDGMYKPTNPRVSMAPNIRNMLRKEETVPLEDFKGGFHELS